MGHELPTAGHGRMIYPANSEPNTYLVGSRICPHNLATNSNLFSCPVTVYG
jgi:hypothetical protein